IGNKILKSKRINNEGLENLIAYSISSRNSLMDTVVQKGILSDEILGKMISDYLQIPFAVISQLNIPEDIFPVIPERIARKYKVIAFGGDNQTIKLGMVDPTNQELAKMVAKK